ncbi:MAG TPA: prolipoprotein diacylglyceryl transferase [Thermoleophilia bacterium]|nr:prolipoprotein diacylglyceryl transferase [Thermoleophilia bacterium]
MIPVFFHIGPVTIYSFGVMAAAALVSACYVAYRVLRTRGVPFEFAYELLFVAGIGGFVGARIYYLLQHWSDVRGDLWHNAFSGSGFTWYGGLIGGFACVVAWSLIRHVPVGLMANAAGPAVAVGYAVGRIGCLLSGDGDYGSPTKSFIGMAFPHGTVPTPPGVKVWPTPPIETVVMLLVAWYLYRMAKKPQPGWYVWGWFMVLAGIERFLIEFIRRNPVVFLDLRTTQWESIVSVAIGVGIILYTRTKPTVEMEMEAARKARSVQRKTATGKPASRKPAKAGRTGA